MLRNSISRRPLIVICLGLLIMAAMIVGLASKTALADEGVPFRGNFTVAISFIQDPSTCGVGDKCVACVSNFPPRFYIEAQGIGDTSKLGTMFLKIQKCLDPAASPFGSYDGIFTFTAPNGKDSLTGIYTGKNTGTPDTYGFGAFSGELRITGGTGRFDDAQGCPLHGRSAQEQRHGILCRRGNCVISSGLAPKLAIALPFGMPFSRLQTRGLAVPVVEGVTQFPSSGNGSTAFPHRIAGRCSTQR